MLQFVTLVVLAVWILGAILFHDTTKGSKDYKDTPMLVKLFCWVAWPVIILTLVIDDIFSDSESL